MENKKLDVAFLNIDLPKLKLIDREIDKVLEKLKESNALADELASRTMGDRLAILETPILDSVNGNVLNGIDISKMPIKSCISTIDDIGVKSVTVVLQWFVK